MNMEAKPARSFALFAATGTIQGIVLWWLSGASTDHTWPATQSAWYDALLLTAVFLPPTIYGLSDWVSRPATWGFLVLIAALLAGAGAYYGAVIGDTAQPFEPGGRGAPPFALFLPVFIALFHAVPFLQTFHETGSLRPPYPRLFYFTWRNALQLALAAGFTGVFWLLIVLWVELFKMIGIGFLEALFFTDARFALLVTSIAFGVGFHFVGSVENLLVAVRQQVLTVFKWLATLAYASGYVWAASRAGHWMAEMGRANVAVALILIAALGLMLTPLLSPYRLSARSVANRILAQPDAVDQEDYMVLRFDTGFYGQRELAQLAARADPSHRPLIAETVSKAQAIQNPWQRSGFRADKRPAPIELISFPVGTAVDANLRKAITDACCGQPVRFDPPCTPKLPCAVLFVDLNGDSVPEALAFVGSAPEVFGKAGEQWKHLGRAVASSSCARCKNSTLLNVFRNGNYSVAPSPWNQLHVGSLTYTIQPGDADAMP